MAESPNRPLRVFLCHSSNDKPAVRELYQKLCAEEWIKPWLDEEELYPGQDWNLEIEKAVEAADVILVCLSNNSVNKEGYVQRELRLVLDYADYKPEGTLYIIPVRLEECEPPKRLRTWQYANYFPQEGRERAFQRLLVSLKKRAESLGLTSDSVGRASRPTISSSTSTSPTRADLTDTSASLTDEAPAPKAKPRKKPKRKKPVVEESRQTLVVSQSSGSKSVSLPNKITLSNGMEFMRVPAGPFLMGSEKENKLGDDKEQPQHTVDIPYDYWMARFPVTNELYNTCVKSKGLKHPVDNWEQKKDHPIRQVLWTDAVAYCQWLLSLFWHELPAGLTFRLPTEAEWEKAARGIKGREWPWGNAFDISKCNSKEGGLGDTTPVSTFSPQGDSPYGCADMAGNSQEWTHSLYRPYPYELYDGRENEYSSEFRVLRGGEFRDDKRYARCAFRFKYTQIGFLARWATGGFRVALVPPIEEIIKLSKQ